jgi:hypothetical protein
MIADLYADWLEHGMAAIKAVREEHPSDYLKICTMLIARSEFAVAANKHDEDLAQFIEERRQRAILQIKEMEAEDAAGKPWPNGHN